MSLGQRAFLLAMVLLALVAAGIAGALWPVKAQQICAPRVEVVAMLAESHNEFRVASAIIGNGLMEIFASDIGTWTAHILDPDGTACYIASGEGWETFPPEAVPPKTQIH